jgi:hypothetical protein
LRSLVSLEGLPPWAGKAQRTIYSAPTEEYP